MDENSGIIQIIIMNQENKNDKIRPRHIAIPILILFNLWELWDIAGVANAYGTLIGFFGLIAPFSGILFFISFFGKDKDADRLKKISALGMAVAVVTFSLSGLLAICRLIYYYLF